MILQHQRLARRRGATLVEAAFVLAIVLLIVFGIFEYGRFVFLRHVLQNAVREGARYAVVHTYDKTTADVTNHVTNYLASQGVQLTGLTIEVFEADAAGNNVGPWSNASFGEGVGVRITGDYTPAITSFIFLGSTIDVEVQCTMLCEAN
jgi:Flp pilus assembly protein TadG